MRLAAIEKDHWGLRSAEELQAESPETFWIPPLAERESLGRGQAARLIFDIEVGREEGEPELVEERMWVFVSEKLGELYLGVLDEQPGCLAPEEDGYLRLGAEVPFRAEHIIEIGSPPPAPADWEPEQPPTRVWPRKGK